MSKRRDEVYSQMSEELDGTEDAIREAANGTTDPEHAPGSESMLAVREHLTKHQKYPATKDEIITALEDMPGIKLEDKDWIQASLPEKNYKSSRELIEKLEL